MIHSVAASICSFNVSLGSTDLHQELPMRFSFLKNLFRQ